MLGDMSDNCGHGLLHCLRKTKTKTKTKKKEILNQEK